MRTSSPGGFTPRWIMATLPLLLALGCGERDAQDLGDSQQPIPVPVPILGDGALGMPGPSPAPDGSAPAIPEPDQVLRSLSYAQEDLAKHGAEYEEAFSNRAVQDGVNAMFTPDWEQGGLPPVGQGVEGLAYAMYRFVLQDYDGPAALSLHWDTAPADLGDAWIGFANLGLNTWEWHAAPADGVLALDSLGPYLAPDSSMLVLVLLMGKGEAALEWLYIGEGEPAVQITDDPAMSDPAEKVTEVEPGIYEIDFHFISSFGTGPYSVNVVFYNEAEGQFIGYELGFAGGATFDGEGAHAGNVLFAEIPDGDWWMIATITDSSGGGGTDKYIWPDQAAFPPAPDAGSPAGDHDGPGGVVMSVVLIDPLAESPPGVPEVPGGRGAIKMVTDLEYLYGEGNVDTIDLEEFTLSPGDLDMYNLIVWPSDRSTWGRRIEKASSYTLGPDGENVDEVLRAHTENGASVMLVGQYALINGNKTSDHGYRLRPITALRDGPGSITLFWFGSVPGAGEGVAYQLREPAGSVPNSGLESGFTTWEEEDENGENGSIGWRCPGLFDAYVNPHRNLKSATNEEYSIEGCDWFATAYLEFYSGGAWAIHNNGGRLITLPMNWGDVTDAQENGYARYHLLENILCAGEEDSIFNSPVTE